MANICINNADYSIFTTDNPRFEKKEDIIYDMVSNLKDENYIVIYDREEAIKSAIKMLNKEDSLLILGKGHEDYQIIGKKKIHFDDKEVVLKYISML